MTCANQLMSLIVTFSYSSLFRRYNDIVANVFLCVLCIISVILPIFAPINLKRQKADAKITNEELKKVLNKSSEIY